MDELEIFHKFVVDIMHDDDIDLRPETRNIVLELMQLKINELRPWTKNYQE